MLLIDLQIYYLPVDRRSDRWTDGRLDRWTDVRTVGWTDTVRQSDGETVGIKIHGIDNCIR